MEEVFKKVYNENRGTIEFMAILLVVTGLMLNLDAYDRNIRFVLEQVKFLLLASSSALILQLFVNIVRAYASTILPALTDNSGGELARLQSEAHRLMSSLTTVFLCYLFIFTFAASLIVFTVLSYPQHSLFFILVIAYYLIIGKFLHKVFELMTRIYLASGKLLPNEVVLYSFLLTVLILFMLPIGVYVVFVRAYIYGGSYHQSPWGQSALVKGLKYLGSDPCTVL